LALISWAVADARGTPLARIHDWGLFYLLAWPVLVPWYLKRQYGTAGWALLAFFILLLAAPFIAAAFAGIPRIR
jgi:hypothetical protein